MDRQGGCLTADQCRTILGEVKIPLDELMVRLLPLAVRFARVPVSGFPVGAVVKAQEATGTGFGLYLGANLEFIGQSLESAVHAEQAAVLNAWHHDAHDLTVLAVTAPPCGYCRQFLSELAHAESLTLHIAQDAADAASGCSLRSLLPHPFGPRDLDQLPGFMVADAEPQPLELKSPSAISPEDPLVRGALAAAAASYAPYTRNWAGCGIESAAGKGESRFIFGRYAESAAFNPSVGPFRTALVNLNLHAPAADYRLRRVVLVEHPTAASQRRSTESLLESLAPQLNLEYVEAQLP
ncbi:MAG: cytidine deaminase [Desulfobacterales bacterium]